MNQPDQDRTSSADEPFMGPAVPPRADEPDTSDDLLEPLAPFFGAGPGPSDEEGDVGDEIPWLVHDEPLAGEGEGESPPPLDPPSYLGGVPEVDIDGSAEPAPFSFEALEAAGEAEPDVVSFEALEHEAEPEPLTASTDAASLEPGAWEAAISMSPADEPPAAAQEPAPTQAASAATRELHVEQAGGFREVGSAVAHEVADRLEHIAHSLRVRAPNELLTGSGDPLEILIVGYVLGAARGRAGPTGEQAPTL